MKTGEHILHLKHHEGGNLYRAHCAEPCRWRIPELVTIADARRQHAEHVDEMHKRNHPFTASTRDDHA